VIVSLVCFNPLVSLVFHRLFCRNRLLICSLQEIAMQGTLLKEIDIKVDKTTNKFKVANKQMKQLLEEVTNGSHPPHFCSSFPLSRLSATRHATPIHALTLSRMCSYLLAFFGQCLCLSQYRFLFVSSMRLVASERWVESVVPNCTYHVVPMRSLPCTSMSA
jgi:hypothetical protein